MGFWSSISKWLFRSSGFSDVREIEILDTLLVDVCAMAARAHPNEMLAFLASSRGLHSGRVLIDEIHLQAYEANEDSALVHLHQLPTLSNIVGTVHSHPGGSVHPSGADRSLYAHSGFVHAIIPEPYAPRLVRYFDARGNQVRVRVVRSRLRSTQ